MFDIAWSEMVVIGAVALIAIGPKDLPKALRAVGAMTAKARRMAAEFQDHFREAMREAELESVRQEVANINQDLSAATSGLQSEFNSIGSQLPSASEPVVQPAPELPKADTALPGALPAPAAASPEAGSPEPGRTEPIDSPPVKPSESGKGATLSVEASPTAVIVTETAASSPVPKPARKKRAAGKPKAKSDAPAQASLEIGPAASAEPQPESSLDSRPKDSRPKDSRLKPRKRAAKSLPSGDDRAA
jgi:sec-independent protein translocase protein TatB